MTKGAKLTSAGIIVLAGLCVTAYFLMGNSINVFAGSKEDAVLAVVNGKEIQRKDLDEVAKALPGDGQVPMEKVYPMLLDSLINDVLLTQKLEEQNMQQDSEVQKRLDVARERIMRSVYVERYVEDAVNDETVKNAYQKLKKDAQNSKEIHARHILLEDENTAKEVIQKLEDGRDFASLAREYSTGPTASKGGDLGYFTKEMMVPAFSTAAFDMPVDSYTKEPVKTQFGWHVIYVEDKRDQKVPAFDDVEPALRKQLSQQALDQMMNDLREGAEIQKYTLDGEPVNETQGSENTDEETGNTK